MCLFIVFLWLSESSSGSLWLQSEWYLNVLVYVFFCGERECDLLHTNQSIIYLFH